MTKTFHKDSIIRIDDELTIIIDKDADIQENNYFYSQNAPFNISVSNNSTKNGRELANKYKTHYKIIATIGSKRLDGVPVIKPVNIKY